MMKIARASTLLVLGLLVAACAEEETPMGLDPLQDQIVAEGKASAPGLAQATIADLVVNLATTGPEAGREFTALLGAIQAADPIVLETLSGEGQFTVFAPTDEAFEALSAAVDLGSIDQTTLTTVLLYHVSRGANDANAVLAKRQLRMLSGDFARINGGMIDNARIIQTDVPVSNGVIHVIDAVLLPPEGPQQGVRYESSIFDLVAALGEDESPDGFSILKAAVLAAGDDVVSLLDGKGQFTVFAPNNQAFLNLIAGTPGLTAEALLGDAELLQQVLAYHVTRGRLPSSAVVNRRQIRMLDGNRVEVRGPVLNGTVNIIGTDNETGNGVVHVIDGVLLPPTL